MSLALLGLAGCGQRSSSIGFAARKARWKNSTSVSVQTGHVTIKWDDYREFFHSGANRRRGAIYAARTIHNLINGSLAIKHELQFPPLGKSGTVSYSVPTVWSGKPVLLNEGLTLSPDANRVSVSFSMQGQDLRLTAVPSRTLPHIIQLDYLNMTTGKRYAWLARIPGRPLAKAHAGVTACALLAAALAGAMRFVEAFPEDMLLVPDSFGAVSVRSEERSVIGQSQFRSSRRTAQAMNYLAAGFAVIAAWTSAEPFWK